MSGLLGGEKGRLQVRASPLPTVRVLGGAGRDTGYGERHMRNFFFDAVPSSAYLLFWWCPSLQKHLQKHLAPLSSTGSQSLLGKQISPLLCSIIICVPVALYYETF